MSTSKIKCATPGCGKMFTDCRRGKFCKPCRKVVRAAKRDEAWERDNLPGYVRLADTPKPRIDPWAQRGDYDGGY